MPSGLAEANRPSVSQRDRRAGMVVEQSIKRVEVEDPKRASSPVCQATPRLYMLSGKVG